MKSFPSICLGVLLAFILCPAWGQTNSTAASNVSGQTVETLVCIRHGEKPPDGLGQITTQGLNRALALPKVLLSKYGKPQFIFAPDPAQKVHDKGGEFNYVRPLVTIDPTAIECGLPVNTPFGFKEIEGLEDELQKDTYRNALIFIAWEHLALDDFVKHVVQSSGGDPAQVPLWPRDDYDSIFVVKITRLHDHTQVTFRHDQEDLNNLPTTPP